MQVAQLLTSWRTGAITAFDLNNNNNNRLNRFKQRSTLMHSEFRSSPQ